MPSYSVIGDEYTDHEGRKRSEKLVYNEPQEDGRLFRVVRQEPAEYLRNNNVNFFKLANLLNQWNKPGPRSIPKLYLSLEEARIWFGELALRGARPFITVLESGFHDQHKYFFTSEHGFDENWMLSNRNSFVPVTLYEMTVDEFVKQNQDGKLINPYEEYNKLITDKGLSELTPLNLNTGEYEY